MNLRNPSLERVPASPRGLRETVVQEVSWFRRWFRRSQGTVLLDPGDPLLHSEKMQGFAADPVYGRAKCLPMLGAFKT
jgi:hypothetical protein